VENRYSELVTRLGLVTLLALLGVPALSAGQAAPLIVESIVDLGRLGDSPTADIFAVGSMRTFAIGSAADAALNPAALLSGPRIDVVAAVAGGRVWRDVFVRTSANAMGILSHEHETIAGPWSPAGFIGVAVRRRAWALGAFYDGSAKLRHRFSTGERVIGRISSPGGAVFQQITGTTHSSLDVNLSRFGVSSAVGMLGGRLAVGAGLEAVRLDIDVRSLSNLASLTIIRPQPPSERRLIETGSLAADEWNGGVTLAARWVPVPAVAISVVHRRVPDFTVTLTSQRRSIDLDIETRPSVETPPQKMDGGDLLAIGASVGSAATRVGVDVVRARYATLSSDTLISPDAIPLRAAGAAVELHGGVEHRLSIGTSRALVIRAGAWTEDRRGLIPQRSDRFVPESIRGRGWVAGGAAFETKTVSVAAAYGRTHDERRVLLTFGLRPR
jgi:hypothetical protein